MVTEFLKISSRALAAAALCTLLGCVPIRYVFLQYDKELRQVDLSKYLADNPLGQDQNIKMTTLGQGQGTSHQVVQIRDREAPHMHRTHDATVLIVRGGGYIVMGGRRITLTAGDIVHIPRGMPHYYVNTELEPTAALVVFAPPFDGKDNVPVGSPPAGF